MEVRNSKTETHKCTKNNNLQNQNVKSGNQKAGPIHSENTHNKVSKQNQVNPLVQATELVNDGYIIGKHASIHLQNNFTHIHNQLSIRRRP